MSKPIRATLAASRRRSRSVPCLIGRTVLEDLCADRPGEELVPGAEFGQWPVDPDLVGVERVTSSRIGSAVSTGQRSPASAGPMRSGSDRSGVAERLDRVPDRTGVALAAGGGRSGPAAGRRSPGRWPSRRRTGRPRPSPRRRAARCRADRSRPRRRASTCPSGPARPGRGTGRCRVAGDHPQQRGGPRRRRARPAGRPDFSGPVNTTLAATASCPSRNTTADR